MMKLAKSYKSILTYAPQTDPLVLPTTGWKVYPYVGNTLSTNYDRVSSETIVDSRLERKGRVVKATTEGEVTSELTFGTFDELLSAAAFNAWVDDTLTFGGDTEKMYAIEEFQKDIGVAHVYTGSSVNSVSIEIDEGKILPITFGFMSRGYQNKKDGTRFAAAVDPIGSLDPASTLDVEDIKIDGVTTRGVSCVTSARIQINNNMDRTSCIGSGVNGGGVAEGRVSVSGSLVLMYSLATQDIVDKQVTGETISLEITINFAGGKYIIALPSAQINADKATGDKVKTQTINLSNVESALTIKRVVNP